jgi:hypothetical protein
MVLFREAWNSLIFFAILRRKALFLGIKKLWQEHLRRPQIHVWTPASTVVRGQFPSVPCDRTCPTTQCRKRGYIYALVRIIVIITVTEWWHDRSNGWMNNEDYHAVSQLSNLILIRQQRGGRGGRCACRGPSP